MNRILPILGTLAFALLLPACGGDSNDGGPDAGVNDTTPDAGPVDAGVACGPDTSAPNEVLPYTTDPQQGEFAMSDALMGLPDGPGPLRAIIDTELGSITCELRPDKAPNAVANFVGLARGIRPWKDPFTRKWVMRRYYDGLTFHRVLQGIMAQGGDPTGTGAGGPGYSFADEISDLKHLPGTMAYANSGPNTNGSQFYVTDVAAPAWDGSYTIFGTCTPLTTLTAMSSVDVDANDTPTTPLHMKTVTITRCAP
jgi:peptidyl-prolyl cis-trans isomerase A (cyclophilin A)